MDSFITYLEEERRCLQAREAELRAEQRKDESDMEKIRYNIFGMCLAIYRTAARQAGPDRVKEVYLKRLEEFPEKWETVLKKAEEFGDEKRKLAEQIKLRTLQEIRSRFLSFRG